MKSLPPSIAMLTIDFDVRGGAVGSLPMHLLDIYPIGIELEGRVLTVYRWAPGDGGPQVKKTSTTATLDDTWKHLTLVLQNKQMEVSVGGMSIGTFDNPLATSPAGAGFQLGDDNIVGADTSTEGFRIHFDNFVARVVP